MRILNPLIGISLLFILSFKVDAISYEVIGPCFKTPLYNGILDINILNNSAGSASIVIFDLKKIPYVGSEAGFNSITNTPTGKDSIEILSATKMRAYGWCYSVNGLSPDVLANNYTFETTNDKLVWYFAYSTYDNGRWVDYCMPSYNIAASQFCSK